MGFVELNRLYLDYNATSPLSASVIDWLKSGEVLFANPASQHSRGKSSRKVINECRTQILKTFSKSESDSSLFFHSGATEAFLTFTYSFSEMARLQGKELLVCYSKIDHPAVTSLAERYWGPHVKFYELKVDRSLNYLHIENLTYLQDQKENRPELIILYHHLWVHNETGFISPLNDLQQFKSIPDLFIHVDAVQAPGKIMNWKDLDEGDVWSFSAHKFGALKGIGFTLMKKNLPFHSLITGGGQQGGLRSGTENPQGVKSIALAFKDLEKVDVALNTSKREAFESFLDKALAGIGGIIRSPAKNSNTVYFYFNKLTSDLGIALFDLHGLELSAGSACSSGSAKASAIMLQRGLGSEARNGIRLSWGFEVSENEIAEIQRRFLLVIEKVKGQLP